MADEFFYRLQGVDELRRRLQDASKKIRTQAVRAALKKAGQVISPQAKSIVPVLKMPTKYRTAGTVKRRISVRPSKFARQQGDEGVFVGVRPIRGAA